MSFEDIEVPAHLMRRERNALRLKIQRNKEKGQFREEESGNDKLLLLPLSNSQRKTVDFDLKGSLT